jgi:hypothetical protein
MKGKMFVKMLTAGCMFLWISIHATAGVNTSSLGRYGEIPTWLIIKVSDIPMDKDPLEPMGGEAKYALLEDPKLVPVGEAPFEIPDGTGGKARIGDGVWEASRMVSPDLPGIWNEYPRLVIPESYMYAYCRLDSPADIKANLLMGLSRRGSKCRIFLNGKNVGTFDQGSGWETSREVPIELKKGANHLFLRFFLGTQFACRLVGGNAEPLRDVQVSLTSRSPNAKWREEVPPPLAENQKFLNRAKEIPPLAAIEDPDSLGIKIPRTMALLESGKFSNRPLRVVFDGQSIEGEWINLLLQRLRERYPGTKIIAENRAIGGWFVWKMHKLIKHDIIPFKPDLFVFSAYQGTSEVWERLICEIRSKTTAEIIIRTQHISGNEKLDEAQYEDSETIGLRRLAQKYDVELIEVRKEWLDYLRANNLQVKDLLRDGIHLNAKGEALMSQLYERHFKYNRSAQGWAKNIRRFDVCQYLEDGQTDGIVLEGDSWERRPQERVVSSASAKDVLKLRFHGTRVDLVMPSGHGQCNVLIDGKKPSEMNLYYGTAPRGRSMEHWSQNIPMTYHTGKNMQAETWLLTLTEGSTDPTPDDKKDNANLYVKFKLTGSKTGFDGEGRNDKKFVSNSGRITILPADWMSEVPVPKPGTPAPEMKPLEKQPQIMWHIFPSGMDTVPMGPGWTQAPCHYFGQQYDYVTVADGLPCGVHELTITPVTDPNPNSAFRIVGIDVHRPPLAIDASEYTNEE